MTTTAENQSQSEPASANDMPKVTIDPSRAADLLSNIQSVRSRIMQTLQQQSSSLCKRSSSNPPRLVAVSKLKPASDILALHNPESNNDAQIHFGENYVQELLTKSQVLPSSIRWHFIGGLQSNKAAQLAREVPNLWAVESVDSLKKANLLNKGRGEMLSKAQKEEGQEANEDTSRNGGERQDDDDENKLHVFVQVNTSGEESKSGVEPKSTEFLNLCKTIHSDDECPHLKLQGLMTIGAIARSQETTAENANEDFESLRENRSWVAEQLQLDPEALELSMGMSEDFEGAIVQGSDEVRVGSTIFGARPPKKEAKVLEGVEEGKQK